VDQEELKDMENQKIPMAAELIITTMDLVLAEIPIRQHQHQLRFQDQNYLELHLQHNLPDSPVKKQLKVETS